MPLPPYTQSHLATTCFSCHNSGDGGKACLKLLFENLRVNRIVVHEVFRRGEEDRTIRPPVFGDALEELSPEAIGAFRLRMADALSGQSQSLQMRIVNTAQIAS